VLFHEGTNRSSSRFTAYPWLIHRLTYRRTNHGETCTFAVTRKKAPPRRRSTWVVLNDLDRFHLVGDVVDRVPSLGSACRICQADHPEQAH